MNTDGQAQWNTLEDVVAVIETSYGPDKGGGLLMAGELFTSYFGLPRHEITIEMMREAIKLLPLYLSWRRLPLDLVDLMVAEAARLVEAAKLIERKRKGYKQLKRKMFLRLDPSDLRRIYEEGSLPRQNSARHAPVCTVHRGRVWRRRRQTMVIHGQADALPPAVSFLVSERL